MPNYTMIGVTQDGRGIYQDDQGCYVYDEWGETPIPCPRPSAASGGTTVLNSPNASAGGVPIRSGQSWFEDLLNWSITLGAIGQGAAHIPTTAQGGAFNTYPNTGLSGLTFQEQQRLLALQNQGSSGAQLGGSLQDFLTKNFTLLAIGAGLLVLWKSGRK